VTLSIDFVQGADAIAPGLSRAQGSLLDELMFVPWLQMRPLRFPVRRAALLFPTVYGPLPLRLMASQANVIHLANSWYAHVVPVLRRHRVVVTCHDLIEWEEITTGRRQVRPHRRVHTAAWFRGMLSSDAIVCDSQATADRIARAAPHARRLLRVVHLGIGSQFTSGQPDEARLHTLGVRRPYVLYVGSEQERKNLPRLVAAIAATRRTFPDLQFVKVGTHQTPAGRVALLAALNRANLYASSVILDHVSDQDLVTLYRGAAATVLVSLHEGFGFPALEAMACGCPTVVSDQDSLPEIVGGSALLVDPLDVAAIEQALTRAVGDAETIARLQQAGPLQASRFGWRRCAEAYASVYCELADSA
jgi:glycosyltransferase involved in cell wall biosynthesis